MRILFLMLLCISVVLVSLQETQAQQQYPVQIQPTVSFPSVFLNDYADPSITNIRVYLADLTKSDYRINIRLKIIGTGGSATNVYYESKTGITLKMNGGDVYFLNDQELATLFSTSDLTTNATVTGSTNTLNEGIYSLVVEAFDVNVKDVPVSNPRTDFTIFNVVRYDPPLLNSPTNGEKFDIQTINQNIFFNWTPRHVVFSPKQQVKYRFRMIKVVPVDRNPYDVMNVSIATGNGNIDVTDLDFPTFIYSPTDLPLEQGAVYAWQVEAFEVINGITKSASRFKNEGKSEVFTFSIKENCDPVTIYPVSKTGNEITLSWSGSNATSDYSEYEVNYRQEGTSMPWTPVLTSVPTITLNNTVLQTDITYEYTVKPKCKNWQSPVYGGTFKLNQPTCVAPAPISVLFSSNGSPVLSWTENASVSTIRVSYKLKDSSEPFTTVDVAGGTQTYTLPAITPQDGYTIKVDAVCGTETAEGQINSFNYGENGIVGPCPVPMPFLLSAQRVLNAQDVAKDTATLSWTNIPEAHTGYSITYWHKDSTANTHSYTNLTAPTTTARLLFDNQLYNYKITFMCGTKSTTTDVGMFRIDGSAGTIPMDPKTADCFPPVDLQGQARSTTSAFVEWNKISGADEYQLFYGVKGTKPFTSFKTTGTSTILKGLVDSEKYQFIVRVRCSGLYSIFSDTALVDLAQNIANKNCDTVAFVAATKKTTTNILLAWEFDTNYSGYIVKYRESAQPPASVYTQEFTDMDTLRSNNLYKDSVKFTFQNLKAGTEYIFTVQAVCGAGKSYVSAPLKVSTLPDAKSTGECGSANACDKTDKTPLTSLNVGDKFNCADYEVTVDVIQNSTSATGKYTGSGHMAMPIAGVGDFVTMRLSFKDITINKDPRCVIAGTINIDSVNAGLLPTTVREQIGGYMDQLTDAIDQANNLLSQAADGLSQAQGGVQDATDYFQGGEGVGSVVTGDLNETEVGGTIPTSTTNASVSANSITMPGATAPVLVTAFPAILKDDAGNVFQVTSTGAVTHVGKYDETLVVDPIVVDPSNKKVVFTENSSATFDFDAWDPSYTISLQIDREYEKIGADYRVPSKFITPGVLDVVDATLSGSTEPAKVQFANGKGLVYKHTTSGNSFTIKLAGGPGSDAQEIYAWYVDGPNKTAIGKLLLPSYTPQKKKVVIIPVDLVNNKRQVIPASVYQTYLNKTYGKIGITYEVFVDESFRDNKTWDTDNNKSVQSSGSNLLSNDYQGEEAAMIQAYVTSVGASTIEPGTAYLLAPYEVSKLESKLLGKMPPQEQFGFIYMGGTTDAGVSRTIAHELGHGAYHLEHIFNTMYLGIGKDSVNVKSSLNLMSYYNTAKANELWKFQWDVVQAPGHVWGILNKDRDAQAKDRVNDFCKIINSLNSGSSADDRRNALQSAESLANENNIKLPYFKNINNSQSEFFNTPNAITNNLKYYLYKLYCNGININLSYIKVMDLNTDVYKKIDTDEGYTLNCESADYTIWFRNTKVTPIILGGFQVVDRSGNINYELSGLGQGAIDTYPNDRIRGVLCAIYTIFDKVALSKNVTIDIPASYKNCYTGDPIPYGPTVTLSVNTSLITEDNGVGNVTATLSKTSETDIKVFLSYRNTALIDVDYTANRFIIIPAGELEVSIPVTAIRDATHESDEFIEVDIQKIEGGATDALKGPFVIKIKESPHPTLAVVTNVHTYVDQVGNVKIMWSSDGSINQLKWRKNSSTTEIPIAVNCSNGSCFGVISGIKKTDLVNYKISTSNPGDPGSDAILSVTNAFQGENCIECLCDGELYTIGNKTFDASTYTIEWRNSSGAAVSEFNGKTTLSSFEYKLKGINTYIIKRINATGIYDEAEVFIKPVLNCTWFLQAKDLTIPSGSGPRVAKNGQTLQLVEKTSNTTGIDAIVEIIEGSTKNAYVKGEPKWEKDDVLISNQTSTKKNDPVIHNQFDPGNQLINPGSSTEPDNNNYEISALNKTESVEVEYFYENKVKVNDPFAIPEMQVYHNVSGICVQMGKFKKDVDDNILDPGVNFPINNYGIIPLNNVITSVANPAITAVNQGIAQGNQALPSNAQIPLLPLLPLLPLVDFQFPISCDLINEIYDINAEKESDPRVVRDTYGKYIINLNGAAAIPLIDLTVAGEPALINYDKNLRKTPGMPPSLNLSGGKLTGTVNRAVPPNSPVQINIAISLIVDFQSPCKSNPPPCLIEAIISGSVNFSLVSNSPFIPQSLLPVVPPLPPLTFGSRVITNK